MDHSSVNKSKSHHSINHSSTDPIVSVNTVGQPTNGNSAVRRLTNDTIVSAIPDGAEHLDMTAGEARKTSGEDYDAFASLRGSPRVSIGNNGSNDSVEQLEANSDDLRLLRTDIRAAGSVHSSPVVHDGESLNRRCYRSSFFMNSKILKAPPDIYKIKEYLQECITPNKRLQVRLYIQAYKEIVKFLCALGTVLSIASRDIESKVVRIDELLASEDKRYYLFLDDMIRFEIESGITNYDGQEILKLRGKRFGTRIMFRLHQAMAFLVKFFSNVREQPHSKMHSIVNEAYKATISRNHGWLVRKTAMLAFHAIPSRSSLIGRMGSEFTEQQLMDELKEIIEVATSVYADTAVIFDANSNIAINEPKTLPDMERCTANMARN